MPDLMGVRDSSPAAFSNFRLALALVRVKSAECRVSGLWALSGVLLGRPQALMNHEVPQQQRIDMSGALHL